MLTYRDKTFCTNANCKKECSLRLTEKVIKDAEETGLPIAVAVFECDEDKKKLTLEEINEKGIL